MTQGSTDKEIADALIEMQTAFPVTVHGPEGVHSSFGLTRREWLMARFPMDIDGTVNALRRNGIIDADISTIFATHAKYARLWADAIIKEAARE